MVIDGRLITERKDTGHDIMPGVLCFGIRGTRLAMEGCSPLCSREHVLLAGNADLLIRPVHAE